MKKNNSVLLIFVIVLSIVATGCITEPIIKLSFDPVPVILQPNDKRIEGELEIKLSGFGDVFISEVDFMAISLDGKIIRKETSNVNASVPGFGIGFKHEIWIPISYEQANLAQLDKLLVSVKGNRTTTLEIDVVMKEDLDI